MVHSMTGIEILSYARRYRRAVLNLVNQAFRVHTHLDWHDLEHWLDSSDSRVLLAWERNRLAGVLAVSEMLGHTTWLRLAAVDDDADAHAVLGVLWERLTQLLIAADAREVGALLIRSWLGDYLSALGFHFSQDIVTLRRNSQDLPVVPEAMRQKAAIRHAYWTDVGVVTDIDHAAFDPLWRMSLSSLQTAARYAASFTVAEMDGMPVGYQLSTQHTDGGHLARLAVLPMWQGYGIGGMLVGDVLRRFAGRGIFTVTVNTQQHNVQSQRLYRRFGFQHTGQDLPFWLATLWPSGG